MYVLRNTKAQRGNKLSKFQLRATNILKKENKINKILRDNFSKTSLVGKKTLCNKKSTLSPLKNLTSMFTDQICMTEKSN